MQTPTEVQSSAGLPSTLSHQKIIAGFLKATDDNHAYIRRDLENFENTEHASFYEMMPIFTSIFRIDEIDLSHSIVARLTNYLDTLNVTDEQWPELCLRDFGIVVPEGSTTSAKTIYTASFLALLLIQLNKYFGISHKAGDFTKQIHDQILDYLKQNQDELWAKAYLADVLNMDVYRTADTRQRASDYKQCVLDASAEQQMSVHPGMLAKLLLIDSEDNLIPAEQLPEIEKVLERCIGSVCHCYPAILALNVLAANYRYVCQREFGDTLYRINYLEWHAPINEISTLTFSPELLGRFIKWDEQLLRITGNILALCALVYMAFEQENFQAREALKAFFANERNAELYQTPELQQLFYQLRNIYQAGLNPATDSLQNLSAMASTPSQDPVLMLAKLTQLYQQATSTLQETAAKLKSQMFAVLSDYFQKLSLESRARGEWERRQHQEKMPSGSGRSKPSGSGRSKHSESKTVAITKESMAAMNAKRKDLLTLNPDSNINRNELITALHEFFLIINDMNNNRKDPHIVKYLDQLNFSDDYTAIHQTLDELLDFIENMKSNMQGQEIDDRLLRLTSNFNRAHLHQALILLELMQDMQKYRKSESIDDSILRLQSGFIYADLYLVLSEFFKDPSNTAQLAPCDEYPRSKVLVISGSSRNRKSVPSDQSQPGTQKQSYDSERSESALIKIKEDIAQPPEDMKNKPWKHKLTDADRKFLDRKASEVSFSAYARLVERGSPFHRGTTSGGRETAPAAASTQTHYSEIKPSKP